MIAYLILATALGATPGKSPASPPLVLPPQSLPPGAIQATGVLTGPRERMPAQHYVAPDDYPAAARATRAEGTVHFNLTIDPGGRVVGCTIVHSSGSAVLDSATCRIMQRRARYTSAMDSNGRPVAGTISQEIVWKAPR